MKPTKPKAARRDRTSTKKYDEVQSPTFYSLPEVYDILHAAGTAQEVTGLERIARRFVKDVPLAEQTWLEPACGSGRYLRVAAGRGRNVIGFDISPGMVEYANRSIEARLARRSTAARGTKVKSKPARTPTHPAVHIADLTTFARTMSRVLRPGSADFAFNLINTIRHLPSDRAMLDHFEQIATVLKPGGVYALGLSLSSYGFEIPSEDIWIGRRGRCEVRQVVQYLPGTGEGKGGRPERVISHLTVTRGRRVDEIDFTYDLRGYDLTQWNRLVARSPLEVIRTVREDGAWLEVSEPGYAIFILRAR